MTGIFLSYRRDDTASDAHRIYERLAGRFGEELVYLDVEDIPLGVDFVEHVRAALESAAYVLIAIGPRWLLVVDGGGRLRLEDPDDPVRLEVKTALEHRKLVVPMLIGGAAMPHKRDLPREIARLVRHNGIAIRPDPDFETDVAALLDGLRIDRLDDRRLPTPFRVGIVARNLAIGGGFGWTLCGLFLGLLVASQSSDTPWLVFPVSGALSGSAGGALVGWLTGLLIRRKSPPLVPRRVLRMGVIWSLGLAVSLVLAGFIGFLLGVQAWENLVDSAATFGEAIGAILFGVVLVAIFIIMIGLVGLIIGSGLAAAFFARQLRMRSEEISRARGFVIAAVWLIGGLLTGVLFFGLASLAGG